MLLRMTDTLLRSLRERIVDESEPLAGLLRKCLLLGAETGSDALRDWARYELNGYGDGVDVPEYRRLPSPPIKMDSTSGYTWMQGQMVDRIQVPSDAREYIPEWLALRQPIDELEKLAGSSSLTFSSSGLAAAQSIWNGQLEMGQQIVGMSYAVSGSVIAGIVGQIRTQLVDLVAELSADTPLSELPGRDQVDAAVSQRIGTQYNTTVHAASGPMAIGNKAEAATQGLTVEDAIKLLDAVQQRAADVGDDGDRFELLDAIAELRAVVEESAADTGEVVKKVGRLRAVARGIGNPAVEGAVGGVAEAFISLAMSGAFG